MGRAIGESRKSIACTFLYTHLPKLHLTWVPLKLVLRGHLTGKISPDFTDTHKSLKSLPYGQHSFPQQATYQTQTHLRKQTILHYQFGDLEFWTARPSLCLRASSQPSDVFGDCTFFLCGARSRYLQIPFHSLLEDKTHTRSKRARPEPFAMPMV